MSVTNRVYKSLKTIRMPLTGLSGGGLASTAAGDVAIDLGDINWQRIIVEVNITALTGTNVNIVGRTTNIKATASTSDTAALIQDGSTAFASGAKTGTGKSMFATAKITGTTTSNIGQFLLMHVTPSALSVLDGEIVIYIQGQ